MTQTATKVQKIADLRYIVTNMHQPKGNERAERLMEVIDSSLQDESITIQEVSDEQYNTGL